MSVRLVVAVTDSDWYEMLRRRQPLAEVNFWAPSATNFRALKAGELFLFKLHSPRNVIVGGGVFAHASSMPCTLAWQSFRESNGASSEAQMRERIARYRRADPTDRIDFTIGCRILTQPFFFEPHDGIPVPPSWAPNIVSFKSFDTDSDEGRDLWDAVQARLTGGVLLDPAAEPTRERFGSPALIRPRLGQGAFRVLVTDLYERRCAVTQERTLPALEAAHIRPYGEGGEHSASNGLLLRRDLHSLFDSGYVTVTPDLRFEVSRRIREEFENGRHYYALQGQLVSVPASLAQRPDPTALAWHNEQRFLG